MSVRNELEEKLQTAQYRVSIFREGGPVWYGPDFTIFRTWHWLLWRETADEVQHSLDEERL